MIRCLICLSLLSHLTPILMAEDYILHEFEKIQLSDKFYSEGATYGDLNKDGKADVVSGPYWYTGPDYKTRHEIYDTKAFAPKGYSRNFSMFTSDFNQDGWLDVFVVGFPGDESWWYQNPGDSPGPWKQHVAFKVTDNESPILKDITGDNKPELLFQTQNQYGYASPDWQHPEKLWNFTPISGKFAGGRFTHGMGMGDVNGDGKMDMLTHQGWLEQPANSDPEDLTPWKMHRHKLAERAAQLYACDLDGDGDNDIITAWQCHSYGLVWHEHLRNDNGDITFKKHIITGEKPEDNLYGVAYSQMHAVEMIDMDGDGILDIVTGKRFWAHNGKDPGGNDPAVLYWFKTVRTQDHKVQFIPYQIDNDSGVGTQLTVGDVTGNGLPDIVIGNKKGTFVFHHTARTASQAEWEQAQPKRFQR